MRTQKLVIPIILAAMTIALTACDPDPPPICTPTDLVAPVLSSPGSYNFVDPGISAGQLADDVLQWEFGADCVPEQFKIMLSDERSFGLARSPMTDGELSWPYTGLPPQAPLEPATEYFWQVRAWTDGVNGPDSSLGIFFTGPQCMAAPNMAPPELISPEPGEVLDQVFAELHYQPGGASPCVPTGYLVDLQTDPTFSGTNLLGEFGIPGTYVFTEELSDCTTYYWRVAPMMGSVQGPFSETRAFNVAVSPTCATVRAPQIQFDPSQLELCGPEDLEPPIPLIPEQNVFLWGSDLDVFLFPEFFQWQPVGCAAQRYKVFFSPDPGFGIARYGMTEGESTWPDPDAEWPQMGLEPATQYFWYVQGWSEGVNGPASPVYTFLTGPECTAPGDLSPPDLIEPADGTSVPGVNVQLHYEPGESGCVPDGYYVDVQTDAAFSGTSIYDADWASHWHYFMASGLEDCTTYYWRVAAIEDGVIGPFSEGRSFLTNQSGTCMQALAPRVGALRDLACYEGPGTAYPIRGYFLAGETANVVAQSLNQQWWYIENPDAQDVCAVLQDGTRGLADMSSVPRWNDPEPEEAAPVVCGSFTDRLSCLESGCIWQSSPAAAGGTCVNP